MQSVPLQKQPSSLRWNPFSRLALVEVQCVMQLLATPCLLRFSRCSRSLTHDAESPDAWSHANSIRLDLQCNGPTAQRNPPPVFHAPAVSALVHPLPSSSLSSLHSSSSCVSPSYLPRTMTSGVASVTVDDARAPSILPPPVLPLQRPSIGGPRRSQRVYKSDATAPVPSTSIIPTPLAIHSLTVTHLVAKLKSSRLLRHATFDVRLSGSESLSDSMVMSLLAIPRIRHLSIDIPDYPPSYSSPQFTVDWIRLCQSSSMRDLVSLKLCGSIRGLQYLLPNDGTGGPLGQIQRFTTLDITHIQLYGNSLKCLPHLPHLREVRLTDGDWALQSLSSSLSTSRMSVLSRCSHLTHLDVSRAFLYGARFAYCFGGSFRHTLQKLTLRGFKALGLTNASALREGEHGFYPPQRDTLSLQPIDYHAAFTGLVALEQLTLVDIQDIDEVLVQGVSYAPILHTVHVVASTTAHLPSVRVIEELLKGSDSGALNDLGKRPYPLGHLDEVFLSFHAPVEYRAEGVPLSLVDRHLSGFESLNRQDTRFHLICQ